jgi:hypothetical protein
VKELMALVKAAPIWEPEACDHVLLEEMRDFLDRAPAEIEWLVEDLIPVKTRGLMVADPKVGKASPLDTPVLTPDGWKPMGSIRPGDLVIGSNGSPTRVLQIHPQGKLPCYKVTMSDGVWVETTAEHLWEVKNANARKRHRAAKKATTQEIAEMLAKGKKSDAYVPLVKPVEFSEREYVISPYVMGVILANGGMAPLGCRITTGDQPVLDRVAQELPFGAELSHLSVEITHGIRATSRKIDNVVVGELKRLGLIGHKSTEKWIPEEYLHGSVQQRWALLQGLLDSDGCFEAGKLLTYTSASKRLAEGVRELVLSLGGTCRMKPKRTFYTKKGSRERHEASGAYTLVAKLEREMGSPFWQDRKREAWENSRVGMKKKPCRKISAVEFSRSAEAQCITVDAADGLYVTKDYILTHNSPLALDLALALASQSSWLGHVVPRRRRVAVISREDSPDETARRLKLFAAGSAARSEYNWGQIWVNTTAHSAQLHVDNLEQMDALIGELKMEQFDLTIFDVLNVLHSGDENDNTVMAGVLAALKRVQTEAGCGILLLHHISKAQSTNIFRDARGAGAIHGWPEWGVGLTVTDETLPRRDWVRRTEFELKYACPADPVYFKIVGDDTALRIELTETPEKPAAKQRRKVEEIASPYDGRQRAAGEN